MSKQHTVLPNGQLAPAASLGMASDDEMTSDEEEEEEKAVDPEPTLPGGEHKPTLPMPTGAAVPTQETLMSVNEAALKRNLFEKGLPGSGKHIKRKEDLCDMVRNNWTMKPLELTPAVTDLELEGNNNNQSLVRLLKEKRGVGISVFMKNKKLKSLLITSELSDLRKASAARPRARKSKAAKTKTSDELREENSTLQTSLAAQDAMIFALQAEISAIRAQNGEVMSPPGLVMNQDAVGLPMAQPGLPPQAMHPSQAVLPTQAMHPQQAVLPPQAMLPQQAVLPPQAMLPQQAMHPPPQGLPPQGLPQQAMHPPPQGLPPQGLPQQAMHPHPQAPPQQAMHPPPQGLAPQQAVLPPHPMHHPHPMHPQQPMHSQQEMHPQPGLSQV